MDENEILSRIDARGRGAAAGLHDALTDTAVPLFDPEVHPVALDGSRARHRARTRWMSAAGIVVLALAAAAVLVVGGDDGGDPADRVGTVEPPRRFAAGHLPEGFAISGVGDASTSSSESEVSGPLVLFGPDLSRPELAVAVSRSEMEPEDQPDGEVVTVGGRRMVLIGSPGFTAHAGIIDVDDRQVLAVARGRSVLEEIAATVEIGEGDRPAVDPSTLPDGWEELGQLADAAAAYGPTAVMRTGGPGTWTAVYDQREEGFGELEPMLGESAILMVTSTPGGPVDLAAGRLFADDSEDVEVRGHPAVVTHVEIEHSTNLGEEWTVDAWTVSWEERPGEVVRVGGSGVSREVVLAVAEDVRAVDADEWAELGRDGLRHSLRMAGTVELGEGTFSDGSPWLAYVEDVAIGGAPEPSEEDATGTVGGPITYGEEPVPPDPRMVVRTTGSSSSGVSSAYDGDTTEVAPGPFLDAITVEGGGAFAWVYGLVAAEAATVELVGPDGEVLLTVEVLRAGGYHGFLMEIPSELAEIPGLDGPASSGPSTTVVSATASAEIPPAPTTAGDRPSDDPERAVLVARADDGTELGRQLLP